MKIINPLYDKAFKYLMENNRWATKVISVILDEEIEELKLNQQETVFPDNKHQLTLFRLDFKATIKKNDGTKHTVLIELQKSKYITDILRFRNYLGSNYMKAESEKDSDGKDRKVSYPIITIYILGYNLDEIPYMAVTVNHQVVNSINKEPLHLESDFINQLNHRSHILQIRRLPEKRVTKLEQFLALFNQAWITENHYILDLQDVPKEFEGIARYLQTPVLDDSFRLQLQAEEEIDMIFDDQEYRHIKEKMELRKEKEEAESREKMAQDKILESARFMKQHGISMKDIAVATGLSEEQISSL